MADVSMLRFTPTLPSLEEEQFCILAGLINNHFSKSLAVVAEGIPLPLQLQILEKVCKCEYVDLATLISEWSCRRKPSISYGQWQQSDSNYQCSRPPVKEWKGTLDIQVLLGIHYWTKCLCPSTPGHKNFLHTLSNFHIIPHFVKLNFDPNGSLFHLNFMKPSLIILKLSVYNPVLVYACYHMQICMCCCK